MPKLDARGAACAHFARQFVRRSHVCLLECLIGRWLIDQLPTAGPANSESELGTVGVIHKQTSRDRLRTGELTIVGDRRLRAEAERCFAGELIRRCRLRVERIHAWAATHIQVYGIHKRAGAERLIHIRAFQELGVLAQAQC